jgi:hypothetical protein
VSDSLELVGKDRDGRALYRLPFGRTYSKGLPRDAADSAVYARGLVAAGGGGRLLVVNRSTRGARRFTFGAALLHSVAGEVRVHGVTPLLVHGGWAGRARDGWSGTLGTDQRLVWEVAERLAITLGLSDVERDALVSTAVEL